MTGASGLIRVTPIGTALQTRLGRGFLRVSCCGPCSFRGIFGIGATRQPERPGISPGRTVRSLRTRHPSTIIIGSCTLTTSTITKFAYALVNGHSVLPTGGHRFSPVAAIFSPHWWPSVLPGGQGVSRVLDGAEAVGRSGVKCPRRVQPARGLTPSPAVACASR
jgi:hypothetical protein